MTDRYSGFVVTLSRDIREDDAEATIAAIRQIKGVVDVKPVISDASSMIESQRMRLELVQILRETEDRILGRET